MASRSTESRRDQKSCEKHEISINNLLSTGRESVVVKTLEVLDQEVVASAGKRSPFCTRVAVGALLRSHPLVVERKWPQVKCVAALVETEMLKQMVNDMSAWSAFDTY